MAAQQINATNITPPRVPLIDDRTGLVSREWYRFFLNLFTLTGNGTNYTSLTDLQVGPPPVQLEDINSIIPDQVGVAPAQNAAVDQIAELQKQVSGIESTPQDGLVEQIAELQKQINGLMMQAYPELGTMAALQQSWLPWVVFDTTPEGVPPDVGTLAWDGGTTLGVQMTADVLGRINESGYYYIKASSTITKGQVIMFTGAVGASGVPTGAPATGVTDGSYIMGVAAENIATNGFGLVQFIGTLRGVDTSAFLDGDILWYNPSVAGALTKTKPSAPNIKVQMAAVISASNNGTILIRVTAGSELGGTDSNVQFGTLANGDLIQYDSALGYWKNVTATSVIAGADGAPVTKTANFTVAASETWIINNKSGSSCTVTLPSASANTGRVLRFQNYQAQTLVSASSNVVPLVGGAAGTAILAAVAGDTATLVSDGANWIMTQYVPNNVLLLE
jgi:hypothetical protein